MNRVRVSRRFPFADRFRMSDEALVGAVDSRIEGTTVSHRRIFGRTVRIELGGSAADRILREELSLYPSAGRGERVDLVIRHPLGAVGDARLVNPKSHTLLEDGFVATFSGSSVRFRFHGDALREVAFTVGDGGRGWRRQLGRWRNVQFCTADEAIGQIFHELVLVPAIYFDSDRFLVHASGVVAPDGRAILFGGTGGVGKTSLELELCRGHRFRFLSDDISVLSSDGTVWPNLAFPKIYAYNLEGDPELAREIFRGRPLVDRLQWRWRRRRGLARVRRRVSPERLYGSVQTDGAPLARYFILVREQRSSLDITPLDAETAAALSVRVMEAEYTVFHQHLVWYDFNRSVAGGADAHRPWSTFERWKRQAVSVFSNVDCFLVRVPLTMEHRELRQAMVAVVVEGREAATPS